MEYIDKDIVAARRAEKAKHADIRSGEIDVDGEALTFRETSLFGGKMTIWLPGSFVDMPPEFARVKYPSEQRPQVIKTNLSGSVNFAFNLFPQAIKPEQIAQAAKDMRTIIKRVNPANVFYEDATEPLGETQLSWFVFKGHAIDTQIYYITFLTSIGGNLLHGIFNCSLKEWEAWQGVAFQAIRSIEDKSKEVKPCGN